MKKIIVGLVLFFASISVYSQSVKPLEVNVGKLKISVDPRMELLSTVQVLSGYPIVDRTSSYSRELQNYFQPFLSHPAVAFTDTLLALGFSYDAPVAFMLQLSGVPELHLEKSNSEFKYISERAKGEENLSTYRNALEKFVTDAGFRKFWDEKKVFYRQIIDTTIADMQRRDWVELMEKYYNESQNSYNIILSPLFGNHNYGPRKSLPDGKVDIYSCNGLTKYKNSIPYLPNDQMAYLLWHEFSHSFVNPNSDKNNDKVMSYQHLFEPIRNVMDKKAYGNWTTCVNEHIVRAIVIRLTEINLGKETADNLLRNEINNKFLYIKPIIEKLKEFEGKRDKEGITFSDYYPELLSVFDSIKPADNYFGGPVNDVFSSSKKLAVIYPTSIKGSTEQKQVKSYIDHMFKFISSKLKFDKIELIADTTALSLPLADYAIIAYGTIESNRFLAHHKHLFPFRVENGKLYADKEYADPDIRFVSCLPNPQNPAKGMIVYTALSDKNIVDINNVFHGAEDYIIFTDRNTILKKGYYNKDGEWGF